MINHSRRKGSRRTKRRRAHSSTQARKGLREHVYPLQELWY